MPIITIDGNIGSYKTSILNYLHKNYKLSVDLEPVENWNEYLNKMYENNSYNSYNFQICVWMDRCWIQEKSDNVLIFMERSPYFIKNVFVEKALEDNSITEEQYYVLQNLHKKTEQLWKPKLSIYLNSNPEMCMQRITKRGRISEKNITLEYIKRLDELHINALNKNEEILIIDVENKSITEICEEIMNSVECKRIIEQTDK